MEIEQDVPVPSIKIPLSVSDECIELFVDELDDDTTDIISLLFGECVPPKYWIQIAVGYYSVGKYKQFLTIIDTILKEENFKRFETEYESKLVLMNYRVCYKLRTNSLSPEEYKRFDLESTGLINWEYQDKTASATALALKCIYCLRTDDLKAAYTYMMFALDRDNTCMLSLMAAAFYHIQSRDFKKAIDVYRAILTLHPDAPASTRVGLAYCFYQLGFDKKALRALDRALQLDPYNEEALSMKATLQRNLTSLSQQDRIESSLETVKRLYAINQENSQALNYIADHYFWTWKRLEGVECRVEKGNSRILVQGSIQGELVPSMNLRINNFIVKIGSTLDCITSGAIVLSSPYNGDTAEHCSIEIRQTKKALDLALKANKLTKINSVKSESYEIAGRCYHYLHNWSHAKELLSKATHANKKNALAQYELSQVCIHLASSGKTKKEKENLRNQAKTQLALCQQSGLSSYELVFLVAYLQFKSNDFARALTTILAIPEKITTLSPHLLCNIKLLKAQLLQGNFKSVANLKQAQLDYETYIQLAFDHRFNYSLLSWNNIAILRYYNHHLADSLIAANTILQSSLQESGVDLGSRSVDCLSDEEIQIYCSNPLNATILFNTAFLYAENGQLLTARGIWKKLFKEIPEYYDCELSCVKILVKQQRYEEAKTALQALLDLLESHLKAESLKESNTIYNYILNSYKDSLCLFISILFKQDAYKEAIDVISHSYLNKLNHYDLYINLLLIQAYLTQAIRMESKDLFKKASDMVKRLLAKNNKNIYLANEAAILLERTNKTQSSMYVLKKIRENTLDFSSCCLNMAILYILSEQYNEAASMLSTVLHTSNDLTVYNLLAFIHMKLHHFDEAIIYLSKALMSDPTSSVSWYNMVIVHLANAQHILSHVQFYHEGSLDRSSNTYSCCGAHANEQGCKCKSLRNRGDLPKAETSIQFALSTLASLQKNAIFIPGSDVESLLIQCKTLWNEKDKQKEIDADTERMRQEVQASLLVSSAANQASINSTILEKEREEQLRIERIVQEEKQRLQASLVAISAQEENHEGPKPRKKKGRSKSATIPRSRQQIDDERVISSDDDTDDAGEEDGFTTKNIFGDDDEDEEEEVNTKKRKRAVESSEDEEEKRPHVDSVLSEDETTEHVQQEVDKVFDDEKEVDNVFGEESDDDSGKKSEKDVDDVFGEESDDGFDKKSKKDVDDVFGEESDDNQTNDALGEDHNQTNTHPISSEKPNHNQLIDDVFSEDDLYIC